MTKKSTAYRLSIYISVAILSVLITFVTILYSKSRKLFLDNIENKTISISLKTITKVRDLVITSQEIAHNTAEQIPYFLKHDDLGLLIINMMDRYPSVFAINVELNKSVFPLNNIYYTAYRDNGNTIYAESTNLESLNHIEQNAVKKFYESRLAGWTEPYHCSYKGEAVCSYCFPINITVEGKQVFAGNLNIELSLNYLNDKIKTIKLGEKGYAFLISSKGTYITHPNEKWILNRNLFNLPDSIYKGDSQLLRNKISAGATGNIVAYPSFLGFKKSWAYYTPIPENKWNLIFVMPYSELFKESRFMLFQMVLISIAALIIIFFLITIISQKLMNPITQLASEIHEFSTAGRGEIFKNEVDILKNSFNLIQAWYKKFRVEQESNKQSEKQYKRDLEQASEIQQNIIPLPAPFFSGKNEVEIFSSFKPAFVVGGDLYDYFQIDENHLLITIGDVSGKGIPAAIFMGVAHTLLKSNTSSMVPKEIVKEVNKELFHQNKNQYFLTLFVAVLNLKTGIVNYCNAAHTTSLILKENGSIQELAKTHGLPLGLYKDKEYTDSETKLSANDVLILYTDGITEMINSTGELFGENNFKEEIKKLKGNSPNEIITKIEKHLEEYRKGVKQSDDYSIVALKYLPN